MSRYNSMAELGDGAGESGTTAATTADADTVYAWQCIRLVNQQPSIVAHELP